MYIINSFSGLLHFCLEWNGRVNMFFYNKKINFLNLNNNERLFVLEFFLLFILFQLSMRISFTKVWSEVELHEFE